MIPLQEIHRVVLRTLFLPWFRQNCADCGLVLPADWTPSDAELHELASKVGTAFGTEASDHSL